MDYIWITYGLQTIRPQRDALPISIGSHTSYARKSPTPRPSAWAQSYVHKKGDSAHHKNLVDSEKTTVLEFMLMRHVM